MKKCNLILFALFLSLNVNAQLVDIITNLNDPNDILFDGNMMYFSDEGSVKRVDISSGVEETLLTGIQDASGIALKDSVLYVSDFYQNQIWKIDLTTTIPTSGILIADVYRPNMMAIKGDDLYYTNNNSQIIGRINLTAAIPQMETVLSGIGNIIGIEILEEKLYYSDVTTSSVYEVDLTDPDLVPEVVVSGFSLPQGLSSHGSYIYISVRNDNEVLRFNPSCDAITTLETVLTNVITPRQTAIHDGYLYVLQNNPGIISRIPFVDPTYTLDAHTACNSFTWIDGVTYTENENSATFLLQNVNGCDSIIALNLTITQLSSDITISPNNILTASLDGVDYQWLDCGNNYAPIPGETNQSFEPTLNGTYAVAVTDGNCTDTTECIQAIVTAVEEAELFKDISVFPNPTSGKVGIDFGDLRNPIVEVYSSLGELLMMEKPGELIEYSLQLEGEAGVYFVKIRLEEGSKVYRVVKI